MLFTNHLRRFSQVKLKVCHESHATWNSCLFEIEFLPYILQLFAFLLEVNPSGKLPAMYASMLGPILSPPLWEARGNVPALVRLLSAAMNRMNEEIVRGGKIEPILGIFQKLVSTKANESHGFDLLESVVMTFPSYVNPVQFLALY
jgi:exportin-2 (importin alpha re-exporter)